jgi:trans-aconitate methyltransferase
MILSTKLIHYALSRFGPMRLRGKCFDAKFRSGEWKQQRDAELARAIEKYCHGQMVVVLGCGSCGLAAELAPGSFSELLGMDLSEDGLALARKQKVPFARFERGNMADFSIQDRTGAVVFSESIYYLKNRERRELLRRLANQIRPHGVIVVTIAEPKRYKKILSEIRREYRVLEDRCFEGSSRLLIVFCNP